MLIETLIIYFKNILFFAIGLLGMNFVIAFHELGHFLFCKLFSIDTPTFSIGMSGPILFSRKIGKTNFVVTAIPLGGYVEIAGSPEVGQGEQKEALRTDEHAFASKPYYQKLLVLFGGILFNMIFAYAAIIGILWFGAPNSPALYPYNTTTRIERVEEGSPAFQASLQINDTITAIDGIPTNSFSALIERIQSLPGKEALITISRDGKNIDLPITIGSQAAGCEQVGMIGVSFATESIQQIPLTEAITKGISLTNQFVSRTVGAFFAMARGKNLKSLAGPIMIASLTFKAASAGLSIFIILLALISINLAVLNLLPLPILDGGQIFITTIEAIIRRNIPVRIKEYIFITCWILVLTLFAYLVIHDSICLFNISSWSK